MCLNMTTYNESQVFCEIENFILSILAGEVGVEQFRQQVVPLIKKSRRFFIDGNNYIAAIIVFKQLEQVIFKANTFKFYDSIYDLPDQVIEGFIQHVHAQSELIAADYQHDEKQFRTQTKKTERFLHDLMQENEHVQIFAMQLGFTEEALKMIRLYDVDLYLYAFLRLIRSREIALFRYIHSVIWQLRHDPAQGYYIQFFCIYLGCGETKILPDHGQRIADQWSEITNGYGRAHIEISVLNGISVNCHDEKQIHRALYRVKELMEKGTQHHYLRVMRHRKKTFECQSIGITSL